MTLVLLTLALAWGLPAGAQEQGPTHRTTDITLGEAVLLALKHNTNIKLAKQDVDISKGELDQVSGEFDLVINSSLSQEHTYDPLAQVDRLAYDRTFETTNITSFKLGVQKLLRSGITLEPNITVSRSRNTLDYPELPASQAKVAFAVIVPLMRGLGEEVTGATERAAKLQLEGTRFDYYHSAAQNIFATVADYWQLREFQKAVEVYADSDRITGPKSSWMSPLSWSRVSSCPAANSPTSGPTLTSRRPSGLRPSLHSTRPGRSWPTTWAWPPTAKTPRLRDNAAKGIKRLSRASAGLQKVLAARTGRNLF